MKKAFFLTIFFLGVFALQASTEPPPFPSGPPTPIPVDGGISFLVAAGAAYGVKKVRDARKAKTVGESNEEA